MRLPALAGAFALALSPHAYAACIGSTIPAPAALILPPVVPQPGGTNDVVGVNIQSTGTAPLGYVTFGQAFKQAQVHTTDGFANAQMDPIALWSDGSVRFAAITLNSNVCAGKQNGVLLTKTTKPTGSLTFPAVALSVAFTGGITQTVNLGAALPGSTDKWLSGPLAEQRRVDLAVPGVASLHLTADVTAYADGTIVADVQFNNDLTQVVTLPVVNGQVQQPPANPPISYTATVTLNGTPKSTTISAHYQYQDWHLLMGAPSVNVQHDLAYLEHAGAVLPYDRTIGVSNTGAAITGAAGVQNIPLSNNGVYMSMPDVGGRPDIGYTTMYDTAWLMTGDSRAASAGIAWGDAGGAVPWNYRDSVTGHWITPAINPNVWTDSRGSVNLANPPNGNAGWTPEAAHMPNLSFVPYLMTAQRWYLARLNAQAAFALTSLYPDAQYGRCINPNCDLIIHPSSQQVRGMAWSLREVGEASLFGLSGDWHRNYFRNTVLQDNWNDLAPQESSLGASEGEPTGWWPRIYDPAGIHGPWEQDYFTGIMAMFGIMGQPQPKTHIIWQKPWLSGRFTAPSPWDLHDGCNYGLVMFDANGINDTWAKVEADTAGIGYSNGTDWSWSQGDFCPLGRAALSAALALQPNDANLNAAWNWINANGPSNYMAPSYLQNDPTFALKPGQP